MRKISTNGLIKKLEHAYRDFVIKRDGGYCQVCGSSDNLVADHVFSRGIKRLFFELDNLLCVCSWCNGRKNFDRNGVRLTIYRLCAKKVGKKRFQELYDIAKRHEPFPEFRNRLHLVSVECKLKEMCESNG